MLRKIRVFALLLIVFGLLLFKKTLFAGETFPSEDPRVNEILEWLRVNEPDKKWEIRINTDKEELFHTLLNRYLMKARKFLKQFCV